MSDTSLSVTYPVMKGSSLSKLERSFKVLHVTGDSSLELQLNQASSVRTFDTIISASRSKSRAGSQRSIRVIHDGHSEIESEPSVGVPSVLEDIVEDVSTRQLRSRSYLKRKKIFELFNFFIVQLLSAKPDNPVDFLVMLLNQCLCIRTHFEGRVPHPLLFASDHVKIVFDAFDVMKTGYITVPQYEEAMKTLGFLQCKGDERADYLGRVSKPIFVADAKRHLTAHLRALIHDPHPH